MRQGVSMAWGESLKCPPRGDPGQSSTSGNPGPPSPVVTIVRLSLVPALGSGEGRGAVSRGSCLRCPQGMGSRGTDGFL